ncbi:hypothetical protein KVR01_005877 [Diaporthe batatas]|uniref:uncharacterized protein n=1 Tax=Diaporthe batatas TaxID=748121 RepID=UPI001D05357D|nr:uncharacterized protein KVR01_005877 [Diaporthe batatas]KAG8163959.1 hypothetical protein KVR01_005877 [Diaporthe batatas]
MADPFSIATSLAKTARICYRFVRQMEGCPDEVKRLNSEVANWHPQLEGLAELMKGDSPSAMRLRDKLEDGGLLDVKNLVDELNKTLEPYERDLSMRRKVQWVSRTKNKVKELLSELRRYMEHVMNIVQMEMHIIAGVLLGKVGDMQTSSLDEYTRRNILEWLRPRGIEADEFHRQKRALRQNGTCDWLAESPSWIDWCKGGSAVHSRFLWIRGLAGAGKTVLASFAIDEVLSKYRHKGVSYYYCSHERQKEGYTSAEEACSFLRWVIRDLTSQVTRPTAGTTGRQAKIPKILHDLYDKHDFDNGALLSCLLAVTEHIAQDFKQQVYIIVDAVDECPSPREEFLRVMTTIGTDQAWKHVSLCFTSRNEHDIDKAVQPRKILIPRSPRTIRRRPQSQNPSRSLQGQVNAATGGFDGAMSPPGLSPARGESSRGRSPSLQIWQFPNSNHRTTRSMDNLPQADDTSFSHNNREQATSPSQAEVTRGLDLMDIDPPEKKEGCTILSMDENPDVMRAIRTFVQSQLEGDVSFDREGVDEVVTLIAQRARGIWAACQVDMITRSKLCDIDSISRMLDTIPTDIFGTYEHMIMKLLPNDRVLVAHYTVKEYLFDGKTALGPAKDFALSVEAIQSLELLVIFNGLQQFGKQRPADARLPTRYEEYCLRMTDKALRTRRGPILRDKTVWKTVTECLKWNNDHHSPRSGAWAKTSPFEQNKEPQHEETSVLVSLLLLQWPELATVYLADLAEARKKDIWRDKFQLARSFKIEGTSPISLIQMCVTRRDIAFLQVLFDARADFSREKDLVMDLFYNAYGHRSLNDEDAGEKTGRMLKMLLERGVRPEAPGYLFTPLQFAVSNLEERWVDDLLSEGADPSAIGDPDGVHPFGAEHDDIHGHLTPLEICSQTTPEWLQSDLDAELIEDVRQRVAESLRRWGAVDSGSAPPLLEDSKSIVIVDDDE